MVSPVYKLIHKTVSTAKPATLKTLARILFGLRLKAVAVQTTLQCSYFLPSNLPKPLAYQLALVHSAPINNSVYINQHDDPPHHAQSR
jgi:hypothetical protein